MRLVAAVCCLSFAAIVCSTVAQEQLSSAERQPNILLLMADQMRADMLGAAGNSEAITPNLDKLAAQGARYRNAFSSTPTCTPARAALLTGLSPWYHGMLGYGAIAKSYRYEMPRALRDAGYYTSSIGKDHFGWNKTTNSGVAHGYDETNLYDGLPNEFDDYDEWVKKDYPKVDPMATGLEYNDYRGAVYALPEYLHPTAWVGRAAVSFLERYNMTKPFFLKVSFHRPHSPYDPPKRWMDKFDPDKMPAPYIGEDWDSRYAINYRNSTAPPGIWVGDVGKRQVQLSRQAYYASVGFVDEWIGNILGVLKNLSLTDQTFVMFMADHGDMMGDHYHWRKGYPYFGSASIPMIVSWPASMSAVAGGPIAANRGSTLDHVTELRDIFPTVLDVANVPVKETLNGSSLLKTLQAKGDVIQWRTMIDLEHDIMYNATNHWNALTDGHWKYVFQAYDGTEQLFNLDHDPHELSNVAGSEKEELSKWREYMIQQFLDEGRGEDWVKGKELMKRVKGQLYSPNYPH